jgi:lysophospholipase L1-like esterase
MLDDTRTDPRPTTLAQRPHRPRRRPGEQPAGQLLGVMVAALLLGALVNADAMVERAERKPLGTGRDRSLLLWHPVQDVAHITQLHRLRALGDLLVGDDDEGGGDLVAAVTNLPDVEDAAAAPVRPVLRHPTAADPLRVYIAGDSVVRDAGESLLRLAAEDARLTTSLHYEIATGLSRPDFFDWPAALASDAASLKPEIALIMFGGNDAQGIVGPDGTVHPQVDTPGWRAEYGRRVGAVMDELRADDRLVLWIAQPPMRDAGFDRRIDVINEVVAAQAADRPWVTFVDTAAVLGGPDGEYVDRLPGQDHDLRQGDGIHLSRAGADLLARHLLDLIDEEIAAAPAGSSTTTTDGG